MGNSAVHTEITGAGVHTQEQDVLCRLGHSQIYMRHLSGPVLLVSGTDQADFDNCVAWIENWYGTESSTEESSETTTTTNSYQLVSRKPVSIPLNNFSVFRDIDFSFFDQTGKIDVTRAHIELTVQH